MGTGIATTTFARFGEQRVANLDCDFISERNKSYENKMHSHRSNRCWAFTRPVKLVLASLLPICLTLLLSLTTFAARLLEKHEQATHVFTGKVKAVHVEKKNGFLDYVIDVTVKFVEKGEGMKAGDTVPISCYLRDPDWLKGKTLSKEEQLQDALRRDSSYRGVPKEGEQIKVYARKVKEKFSGIYPDWYDPVKT